jgi:hypothetical protein
VRTGAGGGPPQGRDPPEFAAFCPSMAHYNYELRGVKTTALEVIVPKVRDGLSGAHIEVATHLGVLGPRLEPVAESESSGRRPVLS